MGLVPFFLFFPAKRWNFPKGTPFLVWFLFYHTEKNNINVGNVTNLFFSASGWHESCRCLAINPMIIYD